MICLTCRDFQRCFPGQTPPPHDCFFGDPIEQLHTMVHTTSELIMFEHALDRLHLMVLEDDTSEEMMERLVRLRRRLLDTLQGVEA